MRGELRRLARKAEQEGEHYRENPGPRIETARRWAKDNPEKRREMALNYYHRSRERAADYQRRYYREHPERVREGGRRRAAIRRARLRGNGGRISVEEWAQLLESSGGACLYCGAVEKLTVDHFVPVVLGGATIVSNRVPACATCNYRKGKNEPETWVIRHFGKGKLAEIVGFLYAR